MLWELKRALRCQGRESVEPLLNKGSGQREINDHTLKHQYRWRRLQ